MKRSSPILIVLLLLWPVDLRAQSRLTDHTLSLDTPSNQPEASIEDVSWLAGHWKSPAFGGEVEEIWAPPFGDSMVGMFKIVRDDMTTMYELFTLVEEDQSLVIKLKHFSAAMSGLEAVDEFMAFPLVRLEHRAAYFEGLTYLLMDDGTMRVHLALTDDGETEELTFNHERQRPTSVTPAAP